MPQTTRRAFLSFGAAGLGLTLVSSLSPLAPRASASGPVVRFPQGVASGDPTPTTVALWTRAEPAEGHQGPVALQVEVARDARFKDIVLRAATEARPEADYTVRVIATDLAPDRTYFYRFIAGGTVSEPLGRTRTAPAPDSDRPVRIAAVSCQNYEQGTYESWRVLVEEDEAAAPEARIDVVLHLGDFIYEAIGYGTARRVPPFPSGGHAYDGGLRHHAVTLDDYRHLYRTYLSDPDLIAARARFPFVCTWDDHEFSNDCWQSQATYEIGGSPAQTRRLAANRAWFEYIPALLSDAPAVPGAERHATDFAPATVADVPFEQAPLGSAEPEPNNARAIGSLTIYRAFQWGRMLDLIVTDTRSYRSAHAVPDQLAIAYGAVPRGLQPLGLVSLMDAGRTAMGGQPPAELPLPDGRRVPNPRAAAEPGSMLGTVQRDWFLSALKTSRAVWKVWGNSVPLTPLRFDLDAVGRTPEPLALSLDAWDGYPSERDRILAQLVADGVTNVVSLTGDHHMHFAGLALADNYRGDPVMVEFAVAGISSQPAQVSFHKVVPTDSPFRPLIAFDRPVASPAPRTDAFNMAMMYGVASVAATAAAGSEEAGLKVRNPAQNRHLRFIDSAANGFAVFTFAADGVEARYVTVTPGVPSPDARVRRRMALRADAWRPGGMPQIRVTALEGEALFPASAYRDL
ncbi:alkaline phosphatase D family protein [Rhodospirillum centenum]|uniref:Alkaline phosphatase D n=1 Tax=Rhodospirillum centenum (strain ATCC 51521 / SW) TaxID=414684 RepID=B6IYK7_RHOCS|nr:alkaline phosphatase D family protein [Rhodospirillum centenum]ACJ01381.1 alkaline phosphatase D [Rhodospirillum centenum SW]